MDAVRTLLICSLGLAAATSGCLEEPVAARPPRDRTGRDEPPQRSGPGFVPPGPDERLRAAGRLDGLDPLLRKAFSPGPAFRPIPAPGPSDWLTQHPEPGQTFDEYVASRPNVPGGDRRVIYLLPIGELPEDRSPPPELLRRFAEAFFGLEARLLPPVEWSPSMARSRMNAGARQILSADVLDWLKRLLPSDAYCLVGLTLHDLYPDPSWNFVFGQASLRERVGVYSFARYDPKLYGARPGPRRKQIIAERSLGVLAHEVGHIFGMQHCVHYLCLMNGSNHLDESDRAPGHLCPVCLRKLHHVRTFDVLERYRKLRALFAEAGVLREAAWLDRRLEWLRP